MTTLPKNHEYEKVLFSTYMYSDDNSDKQL